MGKSQYGKCYWHENNARCDLCQMPIRDRHMIDGLVKETYEVACMCALCHQSKGSGFGVGEWQLYTRLTNFRFIQTLGFTPDQLGEDGDDVDF